MTVPRIGGVLVACLFAATTLTAQEAPRGTARADTVRATCALDAPQPRQCALERLGARLQQVTGSPEALVYDATVQRFRGTQSQRVIPATISYDVDSRDMRAEAVLVGKVAAVAPAGTPAAPVPSGPPAATTNAAGRRPSETASVSPDRIERAEHRETVSASGTTEQEKAPPRKAPGKSKGKTPAVADSLVARDIIVAPLTPTRVVIGHAMPTPLVFGIRRLAGSDTMVLLPSKVSCHAPRRSGLTVVRTRIEPTGVVTCWVQLGLRADSLRPVTLEAEMRFQKTTTVATAVIDPVRVPLVAVRTTDAACNELAQRVIQELFARGRPVVRWEDATRRIQLEHCEQLARLLPVRNREIAPTGFYVRGDASDPGESEDAFDPQIIGPFEFTITKAGADFMLEAVREVVDRLLKYRGL